MIPVFTVPFGYYVLADWTTTGRRYSAFTRPTDWKLNTKTLFRAVISVLRAMCKSLTAQPTVSYKLDNGLSLGLGITYNQFDGELQKAIYNPLAPQDISAEVKGDDSAWGYNIGALYEINDHTRIGCHLLFKSDYTLEGHTEISNFLPLGYRSVRYDASLDIKRPTVLISGYPRLHSATNFAR